MEGTGGLRGAAPNEVRSPSLAGGRGLRRPRWFQATARQGQVLWSGVIVLCPSGWVMR